MLVEIWRNNQCIEIEDIHIWYSQQLIQQYITQLAMINQRWVKFNLMPADRLSGRSDRHTWIESIEIESVQTEPIEIDPIETDPVGSFIFTS